MKSHSNQKKSQSERWPSPLRQFYWDLIPGKYVPGNAGIEAPEYTRPEWLDASVPDGAIEHAIRAHDQADARSTAAQDKAARLLNLSLTLLGVSFALAGWQGEFVSKHGYSWYLLTLVPICLALLFFTISGLEALEIDRVGIYSQPGVEALAGGSSRLEVEDRGREVARWTANKKLGALLQARAWFSRGLLSLFLGALVFVFSRVLSS